MNKVVLEHYPIAQLPEDMRAGLPVAESARVTVEVIPTEVNPLKAFFGLRDEEVDVSDNLMKLLQHRQDYPERYNHGTSMAEAVQRIRELRDEWDDE
ncbi:hypothetical protein [Rhizobium sp. FKY42]|uniref:hypothetical protein n=1 Tax=Rhizobium sp. FKY42 TaxID=2562310 RepID=UPI0010C0EB6F|nr:hypothetical protein [Rhizobium sp. FKY42]